MPRLMTSLKDAKRKYVFSWRQQSYGPNNLARGLPWVDQKNAFSPEGVRAPGQGMATMAISQQTSPSVRPFQGFNL
jgi:hypothetical protein